MTDRRKSGAAARARPAVPRVNDEDVERALGRTIALALPATCLLGAIALGVMASVGSALLVLAAGGLLGAIGLLWASVRTLSGDAPLTVAFESLTAETPAVDALVEEKRRLLRGLKDLENEHEIGKITDEDYQVLLTKYRDEAKSVLRSMDGRVAPFREEAERIARDYLSRQGLVSSDEAKPSAPAPAAARILCDGCSASNEPDAAFCKQCGSSLKKRKEHARGQP